MSRPDDSNTHPSYWREKAARAMRLANSIGAADVTDKLRALAADYLERAQDLTREQHRRPLGQQQQQPQPDGKAK
jgi:hypothetical protein